MKKLMGKLIEISNRPKLLPTRRNLLHVLTYQGLLLIVILATVTFWPDKSAALGALVILCLGLTLMLWFEAFEHRLGTEAPRSIPRSSLGSGSPIKPNGKGPRKESR